MLGKKQNKTKQKKQKKKTKKTKRFLLNNLPSYMLKWVEKFGTWLYQIIAYPVSPGVDKGNH